MLGLGLGLTDVAARGLRKPRSGTTWNPSDKGANIVLSNGNLDAAGSGATNNSVRATTSSNSGKVYWELLLTGVVSGSVAGVADATMSLAGTLGNSGNSAGIVVASHSTVVTGFTLANGVGVTWATNDVVNVAVDLNAGKVWVGKNGIWTSGDPAAGASPWVTFTAPQSLFPAFGSNQSGDSGRLRTAGAQFTNTVPSGFSAWDS